MWARSLKRISTPMHALQALCLLVLARQALRCRCLTGDGLEQSPAHVLAPGRSAMRSHPLYRWIQALCLLVRMVMAESKLCSCVFAPPWNDRAFQEVVTKGVNTLSATGMAIAKGKRTPEKVSWQESMACLAAAQQGSAKLLRALGAASAAQE